MKNILDGRTEVKQYTHLRWSENIKIRNWIAAKVVITHHLTSIKLIKAIYILELLRLLVSNNKPNATNMGLSPVTHPSVKVSTYFSKDVSSVKFVISDQAFLPK